ncbi:MAG TPA: DUF423 domain-containing protein [Chryseosolibacter sp.]
MNQRTTLVIGAVAGALAVSIGAFGAHGLKALLLENQRTETFELAVRYHFYHTFAILLTGLFMEFFDARKLRWASLSFLIGILIFSGSLYALSLTGITLLGAITPLGGVGFILGWVFLMMGVGKRK